ncbi:protein phosphatase 1 regulatory subunit 21-like [Acipenser ruthenus]|uniref:protein phosphatase 1 regulatory subunit 21-like n=1 Tax=Acipenser ruthenus TaxID=7906 RepID=UPI002741FDFF|nr:protein phosphatase 1 regulatory subunit 21-like [Acipenser ruthenus]
MSNPTCLFSLYFLWNTRCCVKKHGMAADLQAKYQKLAQEYSKEQIKMKDQSLRKVEQEMDSLTFRNQQLAKRVELLQEELVTTETRGKKNRKSSDSPSQHSHQHQTVFDEDLQKKIEENERLHMQFFEADEKHRQMGVLLRERLEVLETEGAQHQAEVDGLTQKYMESIEKLQNDKTRLEVKSLTLEREAKECRHRTEECQQQLKKCHTELNSRLGQATSVVQEKVPFNDTKHWHYNTLNVPPHNRRHQLKARHIVGQTLMFIQDLVAALLNFHTYTEQRVQIYPIDSATDTISPLNQKFSQYLHENAAYVRPLEEGMLHLSDSITEDTVTTLETTVKLKEFSNHFTSYTCFLQKILPCQLKSLEEECESSLCTSSLKTKNTELHSDVKKMTSVFEKLQNYIGLLALPSTKPEAILQANSSAVFTQLAACLHGLEGVMKDISKHYSQKAVLEQELLTVAQKLRTTNECILTSLVSLTNITGKIAKYFSNKLDFFTASTGYGPRAGTGTMNPLHAESMLQCKKRAAGYIQALKKVHQSQEKIAKLEQEKEHWMLEAQLARIRLEKENQRISELEAKLADSSSGQPTPESPSAQTTPEEGEEPGERGLGEHFTIGMLTTKSEEVPDEECLEQLIKSHYMSRVVELTSQLQVADSSVVHFNAECRALAKRLTLAEKSRHMLTEEVKLARQNVSRLQDELTTTKRSYEDQLSMMSDHLCSMNETPTKQREEIDTLRMGSKGNSKKSKSR